MNNQLEKAYESETFRKQGHELVDMLADHMAHLKDKAVLQSQPPDQLYDFWHQELEQPEMKGLSWIRAVLQQSVQIAHPRYMGHQVSPSLPVAAITSMLVDLMNNGMAVYEMGQASTAIERVVIQKVITQMGYGAEAGGVLTSGGTLANLTALIAARRIKAKADVWQSGHQGKLALMVSEEAHYCVSRAVRIMGWGSDGLITIPVDKDYKMNTGLLEPALEAARAKGMEVIAVVGSACSTSTGSFDPLPEIADFCERHRLWFHVDGAHGGALCFSQKHKSVLAGIERADSIAMDFHKMLLTPAITTALLFKNGQHSFQAFQQRAQYLWAQQQAEEWQNIAKRTFECTKLMMSLKVYSIMHTYGTELWEDYLERAMENGQEFARQIAAHPDFELALHPQCNIVCFRYHKKGLDEETLNRYNQQLRAKMLEDGHFYIVQTDLKGATYLRVTLTNPFTSSVEISELINRLTIFRQQIRL
jgi:L-2,4-diaminobutyrate decarboxylase